MSHARGFHFERFVSFLNCVLRIRSLDRYSGSFTTVVTTSQEPLPSGSVNVLKNSFTVARSL